MNKRIRWTQQEKTEVIHASYVSGLTCHQISERKVGTPRVAKAISLIITKHGYPYVMGSAAK
jgi:hypothetical protein